MDRRTFLEATSAPLGASALATLLPSAMNAGPVVIQPKRSAIVVVGSGAFGVWTALHLREQGHDVTLLDAYGPGSSRATSGDETRQIRAGYGDRELYARRAFDRLQALFGDELLVRTRQEIGRASCRERVYSSV